MLSSNNFVDMTVFGVFLASPSPSFTFTVFLAHLPGLKFRPNTVPFLLGSKAVPSGRLCQHTSVLTRENNDLEENMINGNVERLFLHSQEYFFKVIVIGRLPKY
ncbi:hypothetical protein DAPPUDRAFT_320847 [Daphnia pulex]|uniref:Uncharacterized protein n=1 Tax=Daphnia pulex TaxID=6669 RepID=E9GR85_DAPPU|nr:hypothetical protein DAPPUDRAFT_320847 [Daphnia pulex]|eukprot:EFX77966.1 hypothetical protein DAPPUDRAFT_320847 [Daphnia pulex]